MEASEYIAYVLCEPGKSSCVRSADVLQISHDEINRFLGRRDFSGKDLFGKAEEALQLQGGVLGIDETVINKPYSDLSATELVGFFWSGLHHKSVKGINLIVLNYSDAKDVSLPVNWRLYRPRDHKTKDDYFQDMTTEVFIWGLQPAWVTSDSWDSSPKNLKFLRNKEVGFLIELEKNSIVSTVPHQYEQIGDVEIGEDGLHSHLKGFDYVKEFRIVDTGGRARHSAVYGIETQPTLHLNQTLIKERKQHWHIEQYFSDEATDPCQTHFFAAQAGHSNTFVVCA